MSHNYLGSGGEGAFKDMDPGQAAYLMAVYNLLGRAFEDDTEEQMADREWLINSPLVLVSGFVDRLAKLERELAAAVRLARVQGETDEDISSMLGMDIDDFRAKLSKF